MININPRDSKPIYEQIKNEFRKLIAAGIITEGEKLPSVRDLASQISINPNTIQRAYRDLEAEGCIYSVPGKGSFASGGNTAATTQKNDLLKRFRALLSELKSAGIDRPELETFISDFYKEV